MEFCQIIGLDKGYLDPKKYELTILRCRDGMSEYAPANGTTGILIHNLDECRSEPPVEAPKLKSIDEIIDLAENIVPGTAAVAPALPTLKAPTKKQKSLSNDYMLFPYANLRYGNDFVVRKIRRTADVHYSETVKTGIPFTLHEEAKMIELPELKAIEFGTILPEVNSCGMVCISTTTQLGLIKAITNTFNNASDFFKYNCLLKFYTNPDYMNTKYGPATCAIAVSQACRFLPVFGKDAGYIIHFIMYNSKGYIIDAVGAVTDNAEAIFDIDGERMYQQSYETRFTASLIPYIKKYTKAIVGSFSPIDARNLAEASRN